MISSKCGLDSGAHLKEARLSKTYLSYAMLVLVTVIWGSTFLLTREALKYSQPFTFLSLRYTFAAMCVGLVFHRSLRTITRTELIQGAVIGFVLFISIAFQTVGAQYITASKAGFLVGLSIPAVPILALPLLRQIPTLAASLGILCSFLGLAMISLDGSNSLHAGVGEYFMLAAALTTALHIVIVGKFAPRANAVNLTIVQIIVTALLSIVTMGVRSEPICVPANLVVGIAALMGLVATAFTLMVMMRVQQSISSTRATLIYALEPVWAGGFGVLAGESLRMSAWGGCGLIFAGMIVGSIKLRGNKKNKAVPSEVQ